MNVNHDESMLSVVDMSARAVFAGIGPAIDTSTPAKFPMLIRTGHARWSGVTRPPGAQAGQGDAK